MIKHAQMLTAISVDGSGDPGEMVFAADVAAPTALTDPNVWDIRRYTSSLELFEVADIWQLRGRISGATPDAVVAVCAIYCYDAEAAVFSPSQKVAFVGVDGLTSEQGNVLTMPGVFGTTHVGISITGLPASHSLNLIHRHG